MVSLEQKEKNQKYILDNLDKYTLDSRGNLVHTNFDMYETEYFCIGKEAVSNWELISYEMSEIILKNKKDWTLELFTYTSFDHTYPLEFRNWKTGAAIKFSAFRVWDYLFLAGEFGYRGKTLFKNYDEEREKYKFNREYIKENNPDSSQTQQSENQQNQELPQKENRALTPKQEPENNNNSPPNQDKQEQPLKPTNKDNSPTPSSQPNNPLPTSSDIQTSYNSDKDKSTIDNNPNLTTSEQKEQAQELLKLIIAAELIIKEQKFDPKTLSQLSKEKKNNTPAYQLLNKEGRIKQVINQLESIQKSQKANNNKSVGGVKNKNNKVPAGIVVGVICLVIVVSLGMMVLIKKNSKKKLTSTKNLPT